VAFVWVAEVHASDARLVEVIFESGEELLSSRTGLCEFSKALAGNARDNLAVSEGAVVAGVADELGGIVEEVLEVVVRDASLGLHLLPVALGEMLVLMVYEWIVL
jgi:hypothetical protein